MSRYSHTEYEQTHTRTLTCIRYVCQLLLLNKWKMIFIVQTIELN